eukprot:g9798.t1
MYTSKGGEKVQGPRRRSPSWPLQLLVATAAAVMSYNMGYQAAEDHYEDRCLAVGGTVDPPGSGRICTVLVDPPLSSPLP